MLTSFIYWGSIILIWYLVFLSLSLVFLPLGSLVFSKFFDRGYPFYKVIGLGISGYLIFFLTSFKVIHFTTPNILAILTLLLLSNYLLIKRTKPYFPSLKTIIMYELLFLAMLGLWSYIKGFEPSIRSLEKYMDFGFIKSILNNDFLPPQDMWYASTKTNFSTINYYYFGHYLTALIIKLSQISPAIGYNLMLSSIFALGTTLSFSVGLNLFNFLVANSKLKIRRFYSILAGILALLFTNLAGNLHTIYLFTKNYVAENPLPFWTTFSKFNPKNYWYPNATRFIPFTIHEFPSYSYVVSDLHGHVLDIPFIILILALFIALLVNKSKLSTLLSLSLITLILAINYMTNSTDFLVYGSLLFFVLVIRFSHFKKVLFYYGIILLSALLLTSPFSLHFKPFASSLGVNCAPEFLTKLGKIGSFMFETGKCQTSPFWMLFILWGFFWVNFIAFLGFLFFNKKQFQEKNKYAYFIFFVFVFSILLTLFAEFFYFKDIYPAHFRANTMFKLGYQAYIMLSLVSAVVIIYILKALRGKYQKTRLLYSLIIIPMLGLILIYPFYSIPSYFGKTGFITLDGSFWIKKAYPEISEIIEQLNEQQKTSKKPFALVEAQGDSYTDYNLVSAHTGIPTIVGWPVHEWLWRGTYDLVRPRAEEIQFIYQAKQVDLKRVKKILKKYQVKYIVVTNFERNKYPSLNYLKFYKIGEPIYQKHNNNLFKLNE